MSNSEIGVIGGAILAVVLFRWWGVLVVVIWALTIYSEYKYPSK